MTVFIRTSNVIPSALRVKIEKATGRTCLAFAGAVGKGCVEVLGLFDEEVERQTIELLDAACVTRFWGGTVALPYGSTTKQAQQEVLLAQSLRHVTSARALGDVWALGHDEDACQSIYFQGECLEGVSSTKMYEQASQDLRDVKALQFEVARLESEIEHCSMEEDPAIVDEICNALESVKAQIKQLVKP